jgi:hypothetical protein
MESVCCPETWVPNENVCRVISQNSEGLKAACGNSDGDFVITAVGVLGCGQNWRVREARRKL